MNDTSKISDGDFYSEVCQRIAQENDLETVLRIQGFARKRAADLKKARAMAKRRAEFERWKGVKVGATLYCKEALSLGRLSFGHTSRVGFTNDVEFKQGKRYTVAAVQTRKRLIWVRIRNARYGDMWPLDGHTLNQHFQE